MSEQQRQNWRQKRAERKQTKRERTGDSPEKVAERGFRGESDPMQEYAQVQGMLVPFVF